MVHWITYAILKVPEESDISLYEGVHAPLCFKVFIRLAIRVTALPVINRAPKVVELLKGPIPYDARYHYVI